MSINVSLGSIVNGGVKEIKAQGTITPTIEMNTFATLYDLSGKTLYELSNNTIKQITTI